MSTLKLTDGAVTNGVLVVGLSFNPNKDSALTIESGTVTLDTVNSLHGSRCHKQAIPTRNTSACRWRRGPRTGWKR